MRNLRQILRGVISFRHHYIMNLKLSDLPEREFDSNDNLVLVCRGAQLIDGTYSKSLMGKIMNRNIGKYETFLLNNSANETVGIISVMYKGGNELEYRIRNIDAFVFNVLVKENSRGRGYAGIMIEELGKHLKDRGIQEAYLAVSVDNNSAIKAYEKAGFNTVCEKKFIRVLKKNVPYHWL